MEEEEELRLRRAHRRRDAIEVATQGMWLGGASLSTWLAVLGRSTERRQSRLQAPCEA